MRQRLQAIQIQPQMYNIAADNNVSIQNIFSEIASFVYLMMMPFFICICRVILPVFTVTSHLMF